MKKIVRFIWTFAFFFLFLMGFGSATRAQNANSGEIKGIVTDTTNAVIPKASVVIINNETGVTTNTETNAVGIYDAPSLPIGQYTVTFSKTGFRSEMRKNIVISIQSIAVNASLPVGKTTEEVVVTSEVPLLQSEDSAQHTEFDTKAIEQAPVVGGIWYSELTNILPGINGGGSQDASGQGVGVNGAEGYMGSFLLDGMVAQQPRDVNASDNYPPIDAISEVSVQTSNSGAQYGNGTASFNAIIKSGTNQFHGTLYEFNQNDYYNARNYFNPAPGTVAPLRWNEFGGSIGGPIKHNKLFFFFAFQSNPNTSSAVYTTTVPTRGQNGATDMTSGCFPTAITGASYTYSANSGYCLSGTLDSVATKIQKYFPAPNNTSTSGLYTYNYKSVQSSNTSSKWYVGKVDYVPNQKHRISGTYMYLPISLAYDVDAFCSLGFDCSHGNNYNEDGQVTDVWTISPTMINEARIGGVREFDKYIPNSYGKGYPTTIGLEPTYGTNAPADIFPTVSITSSSIGGIGINGGTHAVLADGSLAESDVLTLVRGKHTLKVGGEFQKNYQNYTGWGDVSSGSFDFTSQTTNISYADFLLGEVYGWYVYDDVETGARMWNLGAFAQDDYKILPNLTLNLGLRYQRQGGWSEVNNKWGTFDPTVVNKGPWANSALGAMTYGGQNGRHTIQNGANEWVPRIGFSWAPSANWAVRGSYGISDAPWSADPYTAALGVGLNPNGSEGWSSSAAFLLKDGPGAGAVSYPTLSTVTNYAYNYKEVTYYPRKRQNTYYQQILLSVQRQFPLRTLLDVSYVHNKGTHLGFTRDIDQNPASKMTAGTNCYSGVSEYPLFCSISAVLYDGYSNYDALQLRVEKKASHGLSFIFNYAYSKTLDTGTGSGSNAAVDVWQNAFDTQANYSLSTLNMKNSINGSATYELPFGAGKQFSLRGWSDDVLGGWRLTGVYQVHSGIPFTVTTSNNGSDLSGSGANECGCEYSWLPNVVGTPKLSHPTTSEWFNVAAFQTPTSGTFGNERRNSLLGPSWRDLDLSLGKNFQIVDKTRFELRLDSFNILNHPNFEQPATATGTNVAGGGVINYANGARNIQIGGRLTF
jgi:outer membrane receptor protein involved in Fe transport